jgi:hypothetical protein
MEDDNPMKIYFEHLDKALKVMGRPAGNPETMAAHLQKAGFVDLGRDEKKQPLGPWPKDPRLKNIGAMVMLNTESGGTSGFEFEMAGREKKKTRLMRVKVFIHMEWLCSQECSVSTLIMQISYARAHLTLLRIKIIIFIICCEFYSTINDLMTGANHALATFVTVGNRRRTQNQKKRREKRKKSRQSHYKQTKMTSGMVQLTGKLRKKRNDARYHGVQIDCGSFNVFRRKFVWSSVKSPKLPG